MTDSKDLAMPTPAEGTSYPLNVTYCGRCTLPLEYCENSGDFEACKKWLQDNLPDIFAQLYVGADDENEDGEDGGDGKKKSKRGGKGSKKAGEGAKTKTTAAVARVTLQRSMRGRKSLTVVKGLSTVGIDPKVASKFFSKKFACSSSVTGTDEVVIQGDVKDDLFDVIPEQWKTVDEDVIEDLGDVKR